MSAKDKFFIHLLKDVGQYKVVVTRGRAIDRFNLVEGPYVFDRPAQREQMVQQVHELGQFYRQKGDVMVVS